MKHKISIALVFLMMHIQAGMWNELFVRYKPLITKNTYNLLMAQYNAAALSTAPAIADITIKSIPIIECGEELIDISQQNHPRIQVMNDLDILLAHAHKDDIDIRSSKHGYVRKSIYDALERMISELDRLAPHFGYESGELCIKLFEGLRDLETQKIVFDKCLCGIMKHNPSLSYDEAYQETCKWVSPYIDNVPTHSTGAAIDIHLWSNKKHTFCTMGRFNAGELTCSTYSTHPSITDEQIKNRFLLLVAATEAGLINYTYEFWHYSLGDRYACYWNKSQSCAIYDAQ